VLFAVRLFTACQGRAYTKRQIGLAVHFTPFLHAQFTNQA
jgi:hypothetical protein